MDFEWLEDILVLGEKRARERRNPFVLFNDHESLEKFHFHKETAKDIVDILYPALNTTLSGIMLSHQRSNFL